MTPYPAIAPDLQDDSHLVASPIGAPPSRLIRRFAAIWRSFAAVDAAERARRAERYRLLIRGV